MFHCDDAAQYVGKADWRRLEALPDVVESLVAQGVPRDLLTQARIDGPLGVYLFRCTHCGTHHAYTDAS